MKQRARHILGWTILAVLIIGALAIAITSMDSIDAWKLAGSLGSLVLAIVGMALASS